MFWTIFAIFAVSLIAESVTSWLFIKGSQARHPSLWRHSGSPTLMGNGDLFNAWPLVRYVAQRRYAAVGEEESISFADKLRVPLVVSYFLAAVSAIACIGTYFIVGT